MGLALKDYTFVGDGHTRYPANHLVWHTNLYATVLPGICMITITEVLVKELSLVLLPNSGIS